MSCGFWCLPATLQHGPAIRAGDFGPNMRTVAIFVLVLCLGPLFSVAAPGQTSQSVVAAGDDERVRSTESERADGGKGSPALTGDRRPLYRLRDSDVMEISFTFASDACPRARNGIVCDG